MESTTHLELHSQATRLVVRHAGRLFPRARTGLAPSMTFHSMKVLPGLKLGLTTLDHNSTPCEADFQVEHFPLHSPLLWESLLVSFPPLSYMLKSSGSSYLISGQKLNRAWEHADGIAFASLICWNRTPVTPTWGHFVKPGRSRDSSYHTMQEHPFCRRRRGCDGKVCATHRSE
jgi:hypothetical protein